MKQTNRKRSIMKEANRIRYQSRTHLRVYIRDYLILAVVSCVLITTGTYFHRSIQDLIAETSSASITHLPQKIILHLDLTGAPPDMNYLRQILQHVKDLGVTGILLEYDDMFHYKEDIKNLSSPYHYHNNDLIKFLSRATSLGLEVIPLIQTFGHMEHALKLEEFQHLREDPQYPDSICPSKNGSLDLLNKMIGQVMFVHKQLTPITTIHIGGGEVHHLNTCPDCTQRGLHDSTLYIEHIKSVAKIIKRIATDVTILVWDDMFRRVNITEDFQNQLDKLGKEYQIQPVVWDYTVSLSDLSHEHMKLYRRSFKKMWYASAYKGADGEEAIKPDLERRLLNTLNWIKFAAEHEQEYNMSGLVLTGRSRYSHLQPLCELLPMSYKSLVTTLLAINQMKQPHRQDNKSTRYTLNDWELASDTYLKSPLEKSEMCETDDSADPQHAECKLMSNEVRVLHDNLVDYVHAGRTLDNFFDTHNIEAKVQFGYMNQHVVSNFLMSSNNLTNFFGYKNSVLKRSIKFFYSENVYKEFMFYRFYSSVEKEHDAMDMLQHYIKTYVISVKTKDHFSWPRGRNFTVNK